MALNPDTDIKPFAGKDSEVDTILYFTDNENEPKKLNVRRAIEGDVNFTGNAVGYQPSSDDMKDFISACPKTPLREIKFDFEFDPTIPQSNFESSDGLVFTYQNIYIDNRVTAPAIFSAVAYPDEVQLLGSQDIATARIPNKCLLYIPQPSPEIQKVRILFREGDFGPLKIIDEIFVNQPDDSESFEFAGDDSAFLGTYTFLNDKVFAVLPENEATKTFDLVPQKAKSLAVASNRMMYANYEEGFDTFSIKTEATVVYKDKPDDLFDFGIKAVPSMVVDVSANDMAQGHVGLDTPSKHAVTKNSGFYLDIDGLPDTISPGDFSIKIIAQPSRNFHAYNAMSADPKKSVHGSLEKDQGHIQGMGVFENENYNVTNVSHTSGNYPEGQTTDLGSDDNLLSSLHNEFGVSAPAAGGSGQGSCATWKYQETQHPVAVGTSPFAPLIIKGEQLVFEVSFTLDSATSKQGVSNIIVNTLCGENNEGTNAGYTLNYGGGLERISEVNVDLGLEAKDTIQQDSSLADLICIAREQQSGNPDSANPDRFEKNSGYFIINRAIARFSCEKDRGGFSPTAGANTVNRVKICLAELFVNDVKTCIPIPQVGFSPMAYADGSASPWTKFIPEQGPDTINHACWPNIKHVNAEGGEFDFMSQHANRIIKSGLGIFGAATPGHRTGKFFPAPIGSWKVYNADAEYQNGGTPKTGTELLEEGFGGKLAPAISEKLAVSQISGSSSSSYEGLTFQTAAYGLEDDDTSGSIYDEAFEFGLDGFNAMNVLGSSSIRGILSPSETSSGQNNEGLAQTWHGYMSPFTGGFETYVNLNGEEQEFTYYSDFYLNFNPANIVNSIDKRNNYSLVDGECGPGGLQSQHLDRALKVRDITRLYVDKQEIANLNSIYYQVLQDVGMVSGNSLAMNISGSVFSETLLCRVVNMPFMEGDSYNVHELEGTVSPVSGESDPSQVSPYEFDVNEIKPEIADESFDSFTDETTNLKYLSLPSADPSSSNHIPNGFGAGTFSMLPTLATFSGVGTGGQIGSFKTNALHNFGVVYYDQRGRRSGVVPIDPVFVKGYSDTDRPSISEKGGVAIQIRITSAAPEWATDYRIVYGGNSTIEKFTQYSVDGAFAKKNSSVTDGKFFLSLNYLQKSEISYARAGNAKNQLDLSSDLYRFTPGDKLRVISYYNNTNSQQIYASTDEVFDIVEVVTLDENMDNHPFADTATDKGSVDSYAYDGGSNIQTVTRKQNQINPAISNNKNRLNGQFLVVKNNLTSDQFGLNDFTLDSDLGVKKNINWERRCIVEIFTPKVGTAQDITTYYELGYDGQNDEYSNTYGGKCKTLTFSTNPSGTDNVTQRVHFPNVITIDKGDVFFRQVPVNLQKFENNEFVSLISSENKEDTSESNFLPVSLESNCVVDYYKSSARGFGRPASIIPNESKTRNETSIIFSEPTLSNIFDNNFSSFPLSLNFKDLPIENGAIDAIIPRGSTLTVLQRSKVSDVLLNRDILTTASGQENVTVSNKVLGEASFYPINYGSSGSASSVIVEDDIIYFADLDNQKIVQISQKGLDIISERSMDKYFKDKMSEFLIIPLEQRRAVMGYDPVNDELIFTLTTFNDQVGVPSFANKEDIIAADILSFGSFDRDPSNLNTKDTVGSIELPLASIAYSPGAEGNWMSRYDFGSTCYANIRNEFLSFRCTGTDSSTSPMVWIHNDPVNRNSFYGAPCVSMIKSSANGIKSDSPSNIKEFNAVSLESNVFWDVSMATSNDRAQVIDFKDYEGIKYASVPRSNQSSSGNSSQYFVVGEIVASDFVDQIDNTSDGFSAKINFDSKIKHFIPVGESTEVMYGASLNTMLRILFPSLSIYVSEVNENTITITKKVSSGQNLSSNAVDQFALVDPDAMIPIIVRADSTVYGDQLRDSYATVLCVTDTQEKAELYAVNVEYTQSKLNPTT